MRHKNRIQRNIPEIIPNLQKVPEGYKHNPDSHQMCCMWSTVNPPDTIEDTKQIHDIEQSFDIHSDEMEALELYDMNLNNEYT